MRAISRRWSRTSAFDGMVESWESDVPEGKVTDFRKAVDAKPDEKIVFSFFEYPSRAERDAANEKFMSDPRMRRWARTCRSTASA